MASRLSLPDADDNEELSGFETLPFRMRIYRPQYSSSPDLRSPHRREAQVFIASHIVEILREKAAILPGGRDKTGSPIVIIRLEKDGIFSQDHLATSLSYFGQITKWTQGTPKCYTVIIDLRNGTWSQLKPCLKTLQESSVPISRVIIIKPDTVWEKRKTGIHLKQDKNRYGFEIVSMSHLVKLNQYVDSSQLTQEFGGTLQYNHEEWIRLQLAIERFDAQVHDLQSKFDEIEVQLDTHLLGSDIPGTEELIIQHQQKKEAIDNVSESTLRYGDELLAGLRAQNSAAGVNASQSATFTLEHIESVMKTLHTRRSQLSDMWQKRMRELEQCLELRNFEIGCQEVINWMDGPGEVYLINACDIGTATREAEKLYKEHEQFELSAKDTISIFGEVRSMAKQVLQENHYASKEIRRKKDYLDKLCRSFASRMERRRNLLYFSISFHQHADNFAHRLENLLELLCTDVLPDDVEGAETMLNTLGTQTDGVVESSENTLHEGEQILQLMQIPVTDINGEDASPDYSKAIHHVQNTVQELMARKDRSDELSDVRKLKLQQCLQLTTCERDSDLAISWLHELCDALAFQKSQLGNNLKEVDSLQQEHDNLETTAKGTYDYVKQLLQAALVLRRSIRYDLSPVEERELELNRIWYQLSSGMAERAARLSVTGMFYNNAQTVKENFLEYQTEIQPCDSQVTEEAREHLLSELQSTINTGQGLLERNSQPVVPPDELNNNETSFSSLESIGLDKEDAPGGIERCLVELRTIMQDLDDELVRIGDNEVVVEDVTVLQQDAVMSEVSYQNEDTISVIPVQHVAVASLQPSSLSEVYLQFDGLTETTVQNGVPFTLSIPSVLNDSQEMLGWIRKTRQEVAGKQYVIGESLQEVKTLMMEHQLVEEEFKSKSHQFKQLLDRLDIEEESDPALRQRCIQMAEEMDDSWRELDGQLGERRILLDSSMTFHQSVDEFSECIDIIHDQLSQAILAEDVTSAKSLLQHHQELRKSVLELSMQTLAKGQSLLDKLREASSHADINNRHATKAACYGIEKHWNRCTSSENN